MKEEIILCRKDLILKSLVKLEKYRFWGGLHYYYDYDRKAA